MNESEQRLELKRLITRSSVAEVWEAYDSVLQRRVLVKKIHPQYARDSELRPRFEREAQAAGRISHPNVVQIHDIQERGEELWLIFEWVDGKDVRELLKDHGRFPVRVATTIAGEILSGLDRAHATGVLHRDLTPANVMVSTSGEVKITDFGLAALKDQAALAMTQQGLTQGTSQYLSPEQFQGHPLTEASDLFATGLILFEMLTGRPVHEGQTGQQVLESVQRYKLPALDEFGDTLPQPLRPVLARLLDPKPSKRFATAAEAREALEAAVSGFYSPVLIADTLFGRVERKPAVQASAKVSRRRWLVPFLGFLMVAAVAFFVVNKWRGGGAHPGEDTVSVTSDQDTSALLPAGPPFVEAWTAKETTRPPALDTSQIITTTAKPDTARAVPAVVLPDSGYLNVWCKQEASVRVSEVLTDTVGKLDSVVGVKLPSGSRELTFLGPEIGFLVNLSVVIQPGETTRVRVDLDTLVARMWVAYVRPWSAAEVIVDGKLRFATPSHETIYLPPGLHVVVFRNQSHPQDSVVYEKRMFAAGESIHVKLDLTDRQ